MVTTSLWVLVSWQQVHFRCMAWASMEYLQTRGTLSTRPGPWSWFLWSLESAAHRLRAALCLLPEHVGHRRPGLASSGALRTTLNIDLSWPGTLSSLNHPLNLVESADPSSRDLPDPSSSSG